MEIIYGIVVTLCMVFLWSLLIITLIDTIIDDYKDNKKRKESEQREREEKTNSRPNRMRDSSFIIR